VALELAERGAAVVVNFNRNAEAAGSVVDQIRLGDGRALALQADVSQKAEVDKMFAAIKEAFGRLDVLINNAAQFLSIPALEMTEEQWDRVMAVNAKSVWLCSQAAAALMPNQGGYVVNISSECGQRAFSNLLAYSASKAALEMMTRVLAVELAPLGIIVNAVTPGLTNTEMGRPYIENEETRRATLQRTPAGRLGEPEDIAKVAAFLASPDAFWLRGQILAANGGGTL
jgi:NAD(P)-dependent dehydrogenase (short-subunit alcohol dehydrogenase family)